MVHERVTEKAQEPDFFEGHPAVTVRTVRRRSAAAVSIPFMERPTCSIKEACRAAGVSRTKLYYLIKAGAFKVTPVGRRRLVQVPSLLKFLDIDQQ